MYLFDSYRLQGCNGNPFIFFQNKRLGMKADHAFFGHAPK
jgi:hypothetical protein